MFVQISEGCNHCCELLREFRSVHVDPCNLGSSRSFGVLDGLPVLYCLKSKTCRMTSNDGRPLLSQCKMVGSATARRRDSSPRSCCPSVLMTSTTQNSLSAEGMML